MFNYTEETNEILYDSQDASYNPSPIPSGIFNHHGYPLPSPSGVPEYHEYPRLPYGCGVQHERKSDVIVSSCDTVKVVFHSDGSVTDEGFLIRYTKRYVIPEHQQPMEY